MDKPGMIKLSNQQAAAIKVLKEMMKLFDEWDAKKVDQPPAAPNTPLTTCPGRKVDDPIHPLWRSECLSCLRRMAIIKPTDKVISPWTGHGPCPDKMEMSK